MLIGVDLLEAESALQRLTAEEVRKELFPQPREHLPVLAGTAVQSFERGTPILVL